MRILVLIFTLLALLGQGLPADAQTAGRLRLASTGFVPPPTDQTAYFGPKTRGGHGGARPTGITLPATAPDTTNYTWNATEQWAVPKGSYGAARTTLTGCEVMTVTDATATVITYNLCADATIAGDYTVRWRNGDVQQSGVSGTTQLKVAFAASSYGETIAFRGGTTMNTTADCLTGCSPGATTLFNGTQVFRFACTTGNCNGANFNGSNYRIIRPELGTQVTIGPISFENSGVTGTRFIGFNIDGEAESFNDAYMLASVTGAESLSFESITLLGSNTDPYGKDRPSGIAICLDCDAQILNSEIGYVKNGISTQHGLGTVGDVSAGSVAPNSGPITISGNYIHDIGRDTIATQCPRYITVSNNIFTDQKTEVTVGTAGTSPAWVNPFDSAKQPHSDKFQLNMQNTSTNVCAWNLYPGLVITNNFMGRGIGTDSLPFWSTALGFPNPNNYGGVGASGIPIQAYTPDPLASLGDSQGIVTTNAAQDCPAVAPPLCPGADRKLVAGTTPRTYVATFQNPNVSYNVIFSAFNAGLQLWGIDGGTIVGNAVLNPRVATSTNLETWSGFGNSTFLIYNVAGSPTVARNLSGTGPQLGGGFGTPAAPTSAQVVPVGIAGMAAAFQAPGTQLSPRNLTQYVAGGAFLPIDGGTLEFATDSFAGPYCPGGQANTSATCPP